MSSYLELTVITVATKICTADLSSLLKIVLFFQFPAKYRNNFKIYMETQSATKKNKQSFKADSKPFHFRLEI